MGKQGDGDSGSGRGDGGGPGPDSLREPGGGRGIASGCGARQEGGGALGRAGPNAETRLPHAPGKRRLLPRLLPQGLDGAVLGGRLGLQRAVGPPGSPLTPPPGRGLTPQATPSPGSRRGLSLSPQPASSPKVFLFTVFPPLLLTPTPSPEPPARVRDFLPASLPGTPAPPRFRRGDPHLRAPKRRCGRSCFSFTCS